MRTLAFCILVANLASPAFSLETEGTNIKNAILENRSGDCADYVGSYTADVEDIQNSVSYQAEVRIDADSETCTLASNGRKSLAKRAVAPLKS